VNLVQGGKSPAHGRQRSERPIGEYLAKLEANPERAPSYPRKEELWFAHSVHSPSEAA